MAAEDGFSKRLGNPRILVLGDLILDNYVRGRVGRISPEAPIPVFEGGERTWKLGGAGNVVANLRSLEARVAVVGLVGRDPEGERLRELLAAADVDTSGLFSEADRPTTCKTRFLSQDQQLLRWDEEQADAVTAATAASLAEHLERTLPGFDALVLSDYAKGVLSSGILDRAIALARSKEIPVIVDPKGYDYGRYRGVTFMTPNRLEAELATGLKISDGASLERVAESLIEQVDLEAAIITLGKDGIYYQTPAGERDLLPAQALSVYDVTGAGDTVVAVLALCTAAGIKLVHSLRACNAAASIVVGRLGAVTVTRSEVLRRLGGDPGHRKVVGPDDLDGLLARLRREGRRIVFTNGCFDVLHAGHTRYLAAARREGDLLMVGVNDDDSVRRLKGASRPVNTLADRMEVLAALEAVDFVVGFGEDTPERIVQQVTPQVLVKGEDWREKGVVGREWVERHGGKVVLVPLAEGRSTTRVLERLEDEGGDDR